MTQIIDIRFQDEVKSNPLNQRFLDIAKPSVLRGYDLVIGTSAFHISLVRGVHKESAAITPSGAKVTETENVIDAVTIRPNPTNDIRTDGVFLKYVYGQHETAAEYIVVEGSGGAEPVNPNVNTHLLLGKVRVPKNNGPLAQVHLINEPKGIRIPQMIGPTNIVGELHVEGDMFIGGELHALIGSDVQGTFVEKMPHPILVEPNQTVFETHKPYIMQSNSLFVFLNDELLKPAEVIELTNRKFSVTRPLTPGKDEIWAFWFLKMQFLKMEEHDHDEIYYRKHEIDNMRVYSFKGRLNGMTGYVVEHHVDSLDYSVVGIATTQKNSNSGIISVVKEPKKVTVYNTGDYRGPFDISIKKDSEDLYAETIGDVYRTVKLDYDSSLRVHKTIRHYRKDGSVHSESRLLNKTVNNAYSNLTFNVYAADGETVLHSRTWLLQYSADGEVVATQRIS